MRVRSMIFAYVRVSNARNAVMGFRSGVWVMRNGLKRHRYACFYPQHCTPFGFREPQNEDALMEPHMGERSHQRPAPSPLVS